MLTSILLLFPEYSLSSNYVFLISCICYVYWCFLQSPMTFGLRPFTLPDTKTLADALSHGNPSQFLSQVQSWVDPHPLAIPESLMALDANQTLAPWREGGSCSGLLWGRFSPLLPKIVFDSPKTLLKVLQWFLFIPSLSFCNVPGPAEYSCAHHQSLHIGSSMPRLRQILKGVLVIEGTTRRSISRLPVTPNILQQMKGIWLRGSK